MDDLGGKPTISGNPHMNMSDMSVFSSPIYGFVYVPFSIINRCRPKSLTLARSIGVSRGNDGPLASLHKVDNIVSSVSCLFVSALEKRRDGFFVKHFFCFWRGEKEYVV